MKARLKLSGIGPGILVAATGVGAGDLATPAIAGSKVGLLVLLAVIVGAVLKFVLNEGLARWQLVTQTTILEGAMDYYGKGICYAFLIYLIIWSYTVGAALMSASGIAAHAILPIFDAQTDKFVYGMVISCLGLLLVKSGSYKLFEKLMTWAVLIMVISVLVTATQLDYQLAESQLVFIPATRADFGWFMAVLGGVGGTVTILSYGYWINEKPKKETIDLHYLRKDLVVAYGLTGSLGAAMALIGTQIRVEGSGATLLSDIAEQLTEQSGFALGWIFKLGSFAAIFSSLLGVWQSVPYLFTDLVGQIRGKPISSSRSFRSLHEVFMYALAIVPIVGLWNGFAKIQKLYAICGALFVPMLAVTLLLLQFYDKERSKFTNSLFTNIALVLILILFLIIGLKVFF